MEKRENMLRKEVQDAREECMQKLGKQEAERENIEKTLRKEVRDIKRECTTKLGKQEAERENIEKTLRKEVRDIRIEYTKKLGRQEALIKNCLNRQGYTIFEYTGGGAANVGVLENELLGRDSIISKMKGEVNEIKNEKHVLEGVRLQLDHERKRMDSFVRQEKGKRLNMEQRIEKRLVNEGIIVLESGTVLTTPKQAWVDLSVREQQLGSATEALRQASTDNSSKDSQLHKQNQQLSNFRRAQKTRHQKEKRKLARDFTNETTRCRCFY